MEKYKDIIGSVVTGKFVLAIVFIEIFLINLPEIVQVVRAFGINAFVYYEMLTIFLGNKSMSAVRASELEGCMTILFG